jgi:tetratricopeptide (TPR) repeat protein
MPKLAFLPFNVAEPVRPALGRQLCNFLAETLKVQPEVETNFVSYLAQVGTPDEPRQAFVNISDTLNPPDFVEQMLSQSGADLVVDGALKPTEKGYSLTMRVSKPGVVGSQVSEREFGTDEVFETLRWLVRQVSAGGGITLLPEFAEKLEFGTDNPEAFFDFLLGYDSVSYVLQAGPQVAKEFEVEGAFDSLLAAIEKDRDFLGPYGAALQLSQLCAQAGVGSPEMIEAKLKRVVELVPDDYRGDYALAEFYAVTGRWFDASNEYEKAIRVFEARRDKLIAEKASEVPEPEPALYSRLGFAQMQLQMKANAERSFRKAVEMEGPDKPSMELLASVLAASGRSHEIAPLWKEVLDQKPDHSANWVKYAVTLINTGREEEGRKVFEEGLEKAEDPLVVKRNFAPYLAAKGELETAMDYYEDCLERNPSDIAANWEYAQVLGQAGRTHEIPDVLNAILKSEPDQDTAANARAWLYELEQPKRMEVIQAAQKRMEAEDFKGALADLEPLRDWMQDYWKLWAMLSTLYNRLQSFPEAEAAAKKVLEIFPGCEPAYGEVAAALVGQGRAEEAYQLLNSVLRTRPTSTGIAINLAMAAKQTGRADEASRLAKQIREAVGPGNVELEQLLGELERA